MVSRIAPAKSNWAIGERNEAMVGDGHVVGTATQILEHIFAERWRQVGYVLLEAALFSSVVWLNMRAARRLDRRIAELERETSSV